MFIYILSTLSISTLVRKKGGALQTAERTLVLLSLLVCTTSLDRSTHVIVPKLQWMFNYLVCFRFAPEEIDEHSGNNPSLQSIDLGTEG